MSKEVSTKFLNPGCEVLMVNISPVVKSVCTH